VITREDAVRLLEEQHAELATLFGRLDDDAFVRRGTMGGGEWSAKDLAAHMGIWEELAIETIDAFGRGERVTVDGRETLFLLAKNPAGFNEVLRTVLLADAAPVLVIAINDLIADGRDISWLWDVDFEMLRDRARSVVVTGLRAEDMALRLKYAGVDAARVTTERDGALALERARVLLRNGERLYILPTYTAMLHLRGILARKGNVRGFWKQ